MAKRWTTISVTVAAKTNSEQTDDEGTGIPGDGKKMDNASD
jgi:hypothetical protein